MTGIDQVTGGRLHDAMALACPGTTVWTRSGAQLPEQPRASVTIGVFDGLHVGHQALLGGAAAAATRLGGPAVAVTFAPHPLSVIAPDRTPASLLSLDRRIEGLLGGRGTHSRVTAPAVDAVVVVPFTPAFAQWDPHRFISRVLVAGLQCGQVTVGVDFRFGGRTAGSVSTLRDAGEDLGFGVTPIAPVLGSDGSRISSSAVRRAVLAGDVREAAAMLGRPAEVDGPVVRGAMRGRDLGFPTANIDVATGRVVPGDGVYAAWVVEPRSGARWPAAVSVGTNPTFGPGARTVEAHIFDRDGLDLYGLHLRVEWVGRVRGQVAFGGVDALIAQINRDIAECRAMLFAAA